MQTAGLRPDGDPLLAMALADADPSPAQQSHHDIQLEHFSQNGQEKRSVGLCIMPRGVY